MDASALSVLLGADDGDGLLQALPRISEDARDEAWSALRGRLSAVLGPHDRSGMTEDAWTERIRTRGLFALAVGPADVVRRVGSYVLIQPPETDVDRVLASRTAEWREAFAEATLRYWASETEVGLLGPFWWEWWRHMRRLEREGLLHPDPASPDYLVLMVRGLLFSGSIVDAVRADADLAERAIWLLFEPAPSVQKALLGSERYWDRTNTWRVALVRLAMAGTIDPQRLVDAATIAADDERIARNHRAWYRKIPRLLVDPFLLPPGPESGSPPAGNRLHKPS
jgi:hypothetical protein